MIDHYTTGLWLVEKNRGWEMNLIYVVFPFLETNYIWEEGIPFSAVGVTN
jgi:hypothetical protein